MVQVMPLPWPLSLFSRAPEAPPPLPAPAPASTAAVTRSDGWRDREGGIGTDRDPREAIDFISDPVTDVEAIELYRGSPLCAKIVEKIVSEAMRPGFDIEIAERADLRGADGDVGGKDTRPADALKRDVAAEWRRLGVMPALWRALTWERARGGAAIVLGLTDFATLPDSKPGPKAKLAWLRVVAARDLWPSRYYTDPHQDKFGEVEIWQLNPSSKNGVSTSQPTMLIHESRLIIFGGRRVSDDVLAGQQPGFGDSILMLVKAAVRRYTGSLDSTELVLRRNGEPWWAVKDLTVLLGMDKSKGAGLGFRDVLAAHERARSALKLRVVDADDKFGSTAAPLAGVREIHAMFEQEVAAASDTPATILFGETPGGLGDGNQGPRKDWEATAAAWALEHVVNPLLTITTLIMAGMGGEPVEWRIKQFPHSQMTEKEQAEIDKLQADTAAVLVGITAITPRDVARLSNIQLRYQIEAVDDAADVGEIPDDIRDLGEPDPDQPAAPGVDATGKSTDVQATALNGAQVAALVGVVRSVAAGEIPRESGIEIVMVAVQVDRARAAALIGPEKFDATPKPVPPPFGGAPAPAQPDPAKPGAKPPEEP